jgi:hypothetical protein
MSITNREVADMENSTTLCIALSILTQRVHLKALLSDERVSLNLAIDRLREIERASTDRIEVRP